MKRATWAAACAASDRVEAHRAQLVKLRATQPCCCDACHADRVTIADAMPEIRARLDAPAAPGVVTPTAREWDCPGCEGCPSCVPGYIP